MKIIVLQGVPASGKSTWAQEFITNHPEYVIVSKDALREGKGIYWCVEHEPYIKQLEYYAVMLALDNGLNVIIDGTNFNPDTMNEWIELSKTYNAELEVKKFDITFEEACERDAARAIHGGRSVGEKAIKYFFDKYIKN